MKNILLILFSTLSVNAQERIITLSPSLNEIVYALDMGQQVVGNTQYCQYPKETQTIPKVGGYFSPSLEKILSLNPSIVLMQKNNHKLKRQLEQLKIQTKMVKIDTLNNIRESILHLGKLFHKQKNANQIVTDINASLKSTQNIIKNKKILLVFGHNTTLNKSIFVAGQNLYFEEIIVKSGNQNALQSNRKGQPILNMENLIATNPDIVILLAHSMEKKGLTKKQLIAPWLELPISARSTQSVYIIDETYSGVPSDRLVLFLNDFKDILQHYKQKTESKK